VGASRGRRSKGIAGAENVRSFEHAANSRPRTQTCFSAWWDGCGETTMNSPPTEHHRQWNETWQGEWAQAIANLCHQTSGPWDIRGRKSPAQPTTPQAFTGVALAWSAHLAWQCEARRCVYRALCERSRAIVTPAMQAATSTDRQNSLPNATATCVRLAVVSDPAVETAAAAGSRPRPTRRPNRST
jgi:hypothetical protein